MLVQAATHFPIHHATVASPTSSLASPIELQCSGPDIADSHAAVEPAADSRDFMQQTDDGQHPELWTHADLVIVGLSGMGKTPISQHLAEKTLRVANYPLVRGCSIPDLLDQIDPRKVVGLMISPDVLLGIRRERSYRWGTSCSSSFVDYEEIEDEVKWAKRLYRQHPGWRVVNTTDRTPAESAEDIIRKVINKR